MDSRLFVAIELYFALFLPSRRRGREQEAPVAVPRRAVRWIFSETQMFSGACKTSGGMMDVCLHQRWQRDVAARRDSAT